MYYGPVTDVWSLGILLCKLLGIGHPFIDIDTDTISAAKAKIVGASPAYNFRPEHIVRGGAASLVMQMLEPNPKRRITVSGPLSKRQSGEKYTECQLPDILEHPYLYATRPDPFPFRPPSYSLPSKLQGALPYVVIQDLCFLAYLNKEFFLCETPSRIQDRVYGEEPCWEKRWAKMLCRWKQTEEMDWEDLPFPIKPSECSARLPASFFPTLIPQ